jgi:CheY-like chemotaxis protein
LVVDDEPMVRQAIERMLKHMGHNVRSVDQGESALALLLERKFDIVMTDFSMPGMQGDELVSRIRKMLPHQPIIVATAFGDQYKIFGKPSGKEDALLLKPFSLQELRDAIEHVLTPALTDQPGAMPSSVDPHRHKGPSSS